MNDVDDGANHCVRAHSLRVGGPRDRLTAPPTQHDNVHPVVLQFFQLVSHGGGRGRRVATPQGVVGRMDLGRGLETLPVRVSAPRVFVPMGKDLVVPVQVLVVGRGVAVPQVVKGMGVGAGGRGGALGRVEAQEEEKGTEEVNAEEEEGNEGHCGGGGHVFAGCWPLLVLTKQSKQ